VGADAVKIGKTDLLFLTLSEGIGMRAEVAHCYCTFYYTAQNSLITC
jgi:hypothetical protein